MNYSEQLIDLRNKVLDKLEQGYIFFESDLDERYDNEQLEDLYFDLPSTTYYDKNGFGYEVKLIGYRGTQFISHCSETDDILEIEAPYISTDSLVEYINFSK